MARKTTKKTTKTRKATSVERDRAKRKKTVAKPVAARKPVAKVKASQTVSAAVVAKPTSSPKPAALPKPAAAPAVAQPAQPEGLLTDEQLRKVKTGLTKRDIAKFRTQLMAKRAELLGDVDAMQSDSRTNGGNLSNMPLHMADVGSDNYEQEFTLGLVESERKLLREIDEALVRIRAGTYGVCVESGKPIGRARLEAKPWAKYCIEIARERERRGRD